MAKILSFRNKGDAPSGQDFLTDETQTLSFRTSEDGAVSLGDIPTGLSRLFPDPKKDWSNQELADLFRVRRLLSAANVPVETDRGVTDEGDPWFVFCHANGEVFIHLCRIDGAYVLDSPNVLRPLRGADFNGLIADFTNQAIPTHSSEEDAERRVIRLERGGKVRLHPSAMLAALIWTLFLASEELVLLAPEETDNDALLDFDGMFAIESPKTATVDLIFEDDSMDFAQLVKDGAIDTHHDASDHHGPVRDVQHQQQGLTALNNPFTMGLSTIAIAMGFMSETVLLDNERKVLESLKQLGFLEYGAETPQTADVDLPVDAEGSDLLAMLADFLGINLSFEDSLIAEQIETTSDVFVEDEAAASKGSGGVKEPSVVAGKSGQVQKYDVIGDLEDSLSESETKPELSEVFAVNDANSVDKDASQETSISLSEIVSAWQPTMQEYELSQGTVRASFDLRAQDDFLVFDWIDSASEEVSSTGLNSFDEYAEKIIEFFKGKSGSIGLVEHSNGFILVDRDAVTRGQIDYMIWEADDGKIISLIGLASDFEQFDMIA